MRIAFIGPLPPMIGGIVAHTRGAVAALRSAGHEVDAIGYARLYPRWLTGDRPGSPARGAAGSTALDPYRPYSWARTARRLRGSAPDVVVVQYWNPLQAPALRSLLGGCGGARRVVVCHNVVPHEPIPGARWLLERLLRSADVAMFHSINARAAASGIGGAAARSVAAMPLLLAGGSDGLRAPSEILGIDDARAPTVVCLGHQRAYKGLNDLERSWRLLLAERRTHAGRLVIAGEALGTRRQLQRLARLPGVQVVPRYLDDAEMAWLLAGANLAVLPHRWGAQSGLFPTALALAEAVVATEAAASAALPDLPRRAGLSQVPPGDSRALASALGAALVGATVPSGTTRHALRQARWNSYLGAVPRSWQPFVLAIEGLLAGESGSNLKGERSVAKGGVGVAVGTGPTCYHAPAPRAAGHRES
jgi:glycosyltransferase involved in cell wall biosynthesis